MQMSDAWGKFYVLKDGYVKQSWIIKTLNKKFVVSSSEQILVGL